MIYTLPHIIENSARKFPNKEAFRCNSNVLTYANLDLKTNQLAKHLVDSGIKKGDRIGIYMNRCIESVIAVYGIMKSGAVFVPLDPLVPLMRTLYVIKDCDIKVIITNNSQKKRIKNIAEQGFSLNMVIGVSTTLSIPNYSWDNIYETSLINYRKVSIIGKDMAYIMYTSGSTGAPKGIIHTHDSGLAYAKLSVALYGVNSHDRVGNHAPLHFDIATFGYFSSPLASATTIIIPDAHTKLPASLAHLVAKEKITIWYSVPLALTQLLLSGTLTTYDFSSMRWVLFGGENFTMKYLKALMQCWPHPIFSNVYGPAEVNQCSYFNFDIHTELGERLPIGKIWGNTDYKILDIDNNEVQNGKPGELVVSSVTMMLGYWNNDDLTKKSMYLEEITPNSEKTYYRTGDLVRKESNGNIIFLGRNDRQVKIRGYRIELDEIEAVLTQHTSVKEAAVCVIENNLEENSLSAAILPFTDRPLELSEIMAYCKSQLPIYAVPNSIDVVKEFPRTSSGKIDLTAMKNKLIPLGL